MAGYGMRAGTAALLLIFCLAGGAPAQAKRKPRFDPGRASFSVRCQNLVLGYRLQAVTALPGEQLELEVLDANWDKQFRLVAQAGDAAEHGPRRWRWTAPGAATRPRDRHRPLASHPTARIPRCPFPDGTGDG